MKAICPEFTSEEVYSPAEDTFLLRSAALNEARPEDHVLEVGCGSGILSQDLSKCVQSILALDINPHAVRAAKDRGLEAVRSDLFGGIKGRFDLIVFNPPYLPTEPEERCKGWMNYALDGGRNGRETIGRFLIDLADHLKPEGRALLLISSLTGEDEVAEMARRSGLSVEAVARGVCFFEKLTVLKLRRRE